jgi:cell division protease FtsH
VEKIKWWHTLAFFLVFLGAVFVFWPFFSESPKEISVTELYKIIIAENVKEFTIETSENSVSGILKDGNRFRAVVADVQELEKLAVAHNVIVRVQKPLSALNLIFWAAVFAAALGALGLLALLWISQRQYKQLNELQGGSGFMSGNFMPGNFTFEKEVKTRFDDVGGCAEAKEDIREVIDFLKRPKEYEKLGVRVPKGILLVGPPGSGKTLIARAIAGEAGVPFCAADGSKFDEIFVGVGPKRVRELFDLARQRAPCIVFIDEIHAVGTARHFSVDSHEYGKTLSQLLTQIDGFKQSGRILVIGATNEPEKLDERLLRSGRFDRKLIIEKPDVKGREEILKIHVRLHKTPLADDVRLLEAARATPGVSGADLEEIVNEAAIFALRKNHKKVFQDDFNDAIDKVLYGSARQRVILPEEKEITAYHEAGHTLVAKHRQAEGAEPIRRVTIIPRGLSGGATHLLPKGDRTLLTKPYLLVYLSVTMGGRAAEMAKFQQGSSGASSDFQTATEIARKMICEWGMDDYVGKVVYRKPQQFLGGLSEESRCSPQTQKLIEDRVKCLLDNAYEEAVKIIRDHRNQLDRLAWALMEKETLNSEEIDKILAPT